MSVSIFTRLLVPLATLFVCAACAPEAPVPNVAADTEAFLSAVDDFGKAFNNKDATAVTALYADDAKLFPPGGTEISGSAAIRDHYAYEIANHWVHITWTLEGSGVSGDWAWRSASWSADTSPVTTGKTIEVWHRTTSGWRIYRDIWNADTGG